MKRLIFIREILGLPKWLKKLKNVVLQGEFLRDSCARLEAFVGRFRPIYVSPIKRSTWTYLTLLQTLRPHLV